MTSLNSDAAWPSVSVVMPVRNEAKHILAAVDAVLDQEYEGDIDIWIAIAPSDDETEQIVEELAQENPKVHPVRNDVGVTPVGL
ncbi:MAG: glycosyltransferase, partial [Actinomycetota bacterium]|nr:glycosyltransferase [Actinomycetota bacterium]